MPAHLWTFGTIILWFGAVALCPEKALAQKTDKKPAVSFAKEVVPILTKYCIKCHGGARPNGEFSPEKVQGEYTPPQKPPNWAQAAHKFPPPDPPPPGKTQPTPEA